MSKTYEELKQEFKDDCKVEPSSNVTSDGHIEAYDEIMNSMGFHRILEPEVDIDMVKKPPHYNQGGIETITYMKAYSTKEEFMGHCRLTAIKYLSRLMEKENSLQDAMKARWYLNKLIEELQ
jgi:hypothetical protein